MGVEEGLKIWEGWVLLGRFLIKIGRVVGVDWRCRLGWFVSGFGVCFVFS